MFLLTDADGDGEWLLRSAARTVEPQMPDAVLTELFKGPSPEEFAAGFESALPETLGLRTAIAVAGVLNVDVTSEILELPLARLQLAVAQIVYTASEFDNVREVRLRVDGPAAGVAERPRRATDRGAHRVRLPRLRRVDATTLPGDPQPSRPRSYSKNTSATSW